MEAQTTAPDDSLLKWIQAFSPEVRLSSLSALKDGELLVRVAKDIMLYHEDNESLQDASARFSYIRNTMEEFYGRSMRDEINLLHLQSETHYSAAIQRVLIVLLCAAVQSSNNTEYIKTITGFDTATQTNIMTTIENNMPHLKVPAFPSAAAAAAAAAATGSPLLSGTAKPSSSLSTTSALSFASGLQSEGRGTVSFAASPMVCLTPTSTNRAQSRLATPLTTGMAATPDPKRALISSLRREISSLRAQLEENQCMHDEVLRELNSKIAAYNDLEVRYREASVIAEQCRALQDQVDSLAQSAERCGRLESELSRLRPQLAAAKAEAQGAQQMRRDFVKLEVEKAELAHSASVNEERVKEYRVSLASAELQISDLKASSTRKDVELTRLMGVAETLTREKATLTRELQCARDELQAARSEQGSVEDARPESAAALEAAAKEMEVLREHIHSLMGDLGRMQAAEDKLRDANQLSELKQQAAEREMAELRDKLSTCEAKLRMTEDAFASARSEWQQARQTRRDSVARAMQTEFEAKMSALTGKMEEMKRRHQKDIEMMESLHGLKVQELNRACAELRQTVQSQQALLAAQQRGEHARPTTAATTATAVSASSFAGGDEQRHGRTAGARELSLSLRQPLGTLENDNMTDEERVRMLKMRNKQYQPHLQSSYALELQEAPMDQRLVVKSPALSQKLSATAPAKTLPMHLRESEPAVLEEPAEATVPAEKPKAVVLEFSPQTKPAARPPPRLTDKRDVSVKSLRPPTALARSSVPVRPK